MQIKNQFLALLAIPSLLDQNATMTLATSERPTLEGNVDVVPNMVFRIDVKLVQIKCRISWNTFIKGNCRW